MTVDRDAKRRMVNILDSAIEVLEQKRNEMASVSKAVEIVSAALDEVSQDSGYYSDEASQTRRVLKRLMVRLLSL